MASIEAHRSTGRSPGSTEASDEDPPDKCSRGRRGESARLHMQALGLEKKEDIARREPRWLTVNSPGNPTDSSWCSSPTHHPGGRAFQAGPDERRNPVDLLRGRGRTRNSTDSRPCWRRPSPRIRPTWDRHHRGPRHTCGNLIQIGGAARERVRARRRVSAARRSRAAVGAARGAQLVPASSFGGCSRGGGCGRVGHLVERRSMLARTLAFRSTSRRSPRSISVAFQT